MRYLFISKLTGLIEAFELRLKFRLQLQRPRVFARILLFRRGSCSFMNAVVCFEFCTIFGYTVRDKIVIFVNFV